MLNGEKTAACIWLEIQIFNCLRHSIEKLALFQCIGIWHYIALVNSPRENPPIEREFRAFEDRVGQHPFQKPRGTLEGFEPPRPGTVFPQRGVTWGKEPTSNLRWEMELGDINGLLRIG